jgi:molybdopterin-guanine dinucleotide biosynthesis protein
VHILTVAGAGSGAGKTTLSALLLKRLPGFAAIKVSAGGMYASVTDDPAVILEEGKDTRILKDAGADPVVLVRCPPQDVAEALDQAMAMAGNARGVLVEGNSAALLVRATVSFFVAAQDVTDMKESAQDAFSRADVVVVNVEENTPPAAAEERIRLHNRAAAITTMGRVRAGSPELDELVERLSR